MSTPSRHAFALRAEFTIGPAFGRTRWAGDLPRKRGRCGSLIALAAIALLIASSAAFAQDYPTRPITMIVPFPPGGGNDTMACIVAGKLTAALGQQVLVDNRGGANGVIAMRTGAREDALWGPLVRKLNIKVD